MRTSYDRNTVATRPSDPFTRLFESFFGTVPAEFTPAGLSPRTNIAETEHAYTFAFELPGIDEKQIQLELSENRLVVSAERKDERKTENTTWHRVEHRYGTMTRSIELPPDAKADAIEASYNKGVLTVTVAKQEPVKPTRIQIKGA